MVFPVVMYGCESWTIKKAERWRVDAFELWYWRRLLRVHWTARRSNQSFLKEISLEYSLQGLMLKLKLQYCGHLTQRADSFKRPWFWETLKVEEKGMTEDAMVGWHHQLSVHEFEQAHVVGDGQESLACYSPWGCKESDMIDRLNWTEAGWQYLTLMCSFSNFEPVHCSMPSSNCCFLTCIQTSQEAGKVVWYSHLFKIFHSCDPHSQRF